MANPSLRSTSHQIEGVKIIPEMDYVPFIGGMDIVREIYQLPMASYSDITNMRPMRPGFMKRKGMLKLHSTADGVNKCLSLHMFSKGKQSELHTYAQMSDGDLNELTNNPPTVTSGIMGTSVYNTTDTTNLLPGSYAAMNDRLLYSDGTKGPYIYSGNTEYVSAFIVYKGAATIPDVPLIGEDYSYEVADEDTTTVAVLDSLSTLAAYDCVFIRTDTPADTFTFTVLYANGSAAVAQLHYWNGSTWAAVTGLTDNTAITGATLAQTGTMTWTMITDHQPKYMYGANSYWYRLSLASGGLDSEVEVNKVTYNSDFVPVQNVWDGVALPAIEAYVYDQSAANYTFHAASAIDIGGLVASNDKFYFNSYYPAIGFYVSVGAVPNAVAATTIQVKYWNGSAWADVTENDSTIVDAKSFAQDGWVTWAHPSDEHQTMFQSSQYYTYWYEVGFDKTLTADMTVSIETMPYLDMVDFGKCYTLCTFKNRIAYSFEKLPGFVAISGANYPMGLNGSDLGIQDVGDGRANKVTCMKRFYNEMMVWQEEKGKEGGCLTLVEGSSVQTFGKRILSTTHGTFSPKSAIVVEDIPVSKSKDETPNKVTMAYFLCRDGMFRCDGLTVEGISFSIQDYFDPKNALCIRRGYEKEHWVDYDSTYKVIRVGLISGPSAEVPNVFLVYDPFANAWNHDVLTQPLSCHAEIEATTGQFPLLQIGGGTADGTVQLLNYGTNDNGTNYTASCTMEFDGGGHDLHLEQLTIRLSGGCTVTPYADTVAKTAITIAP